MESWSSTRTGNRSAPHHHRLPDRLHSVPPSLPLWTCEMTDWSAISSSNNLNKPSSALVVEQRRRPSILLVPPFDNESSNRAPPAAAGQLSPETAAAAAALASQEPHLLTATAVATDETEVPTERRGSGRSERSLKLSPRKLERRLYSYFDVGDEEEGERERRKSETTSFFNLGFRRKSTVVYYAANE